MNNMSNNEKKLERITALLEEMGLGYKRNHHSRFNDVDIDIYVPKYRIAVFDGQTQEKFDKVKGKYAPLFVRDEETEDFVIEKMVNLLGQREKKLQRLLENLEKRKANLIYAEECERRHQERLARREAAQAAQAERRRIREEKAAAKAKAERPKRKRIVRYEKV